MKQTLWTKNFTIITWGTVISMLGAAVSNFALSLIVFEETQSTFLFSLVTFCSVLPNMVLPTIVGPLLDRFSRRKMIYTLDFISAGLFALISAGLYFDVLNYWIFLLTGVTLGCINATYMVAYDSFYPNLISEGNYSKAYSISSLIFPICNTIMVPVAAKWNQFLGMPSLFLFTGIMYFIAAVFETQIKFDEKYIQNANKQAGRAQIFKDFKEGVAYLKEEKSLLRVSQYFFVSNLCGAVLGTLMLPFFKLTPNYNDTQYAFLISTMTLGRILGGLAHYHFKYPTHLKYQITMFVYSTIAIVDMFLLFSPFPVMIGMQFLNGVLSVTSFNIRTSATQSYVSDDKRARFNGIFMMITFFGVGIGQLLSGYLGDHFDIRYIVMVFMAINLISVYFIMMRNKNDVKFLYNRSV